MPLFTLSLVVIGFGIIGWRIKAQGGWRNFAPPALRLAPLPIVGLGLQFFALQSAGGTERVILYATSLVLLVSFFVVNWQQRALRLLAAGFLLNLLPILFNGGYMPITPETMSALHSKPQTMQWVEGLTRAGSKDIILPAEQAPFWFLGDVFVLSRPFPMPTAFSIGDLIILIGFGCLLIGSRQSPEFNMSQIDLERLVCAGAVDGQFRELLLRDPLRAAEGYHANRFALTAEERTLLANIQTNDFDTFVQTVANLLAEKRARLVAQSNRMHTSRFR